MLILKQVKMINNSYMKSLKKSIASILALAVILAGLFSYKDFSIEAMAAEAVEYADDSYTDYISSFHEITADHEILAVVYLCDSYDLLETASDDATPIVNVPCGSTFILTDVHVVGESGEKVLWYEASCYYNGNTYTGFTKRDNLAISDEDFLNWESEAKAAITDSLARRSVRRAARNAVDYSDVNQFPASYQDALRTLKAKHANWIFVPYYTNLDWQTAVSAEAGNSKSLVSASFYDYHKEGLCESGWYFANEDTIKWYMDPRAWLTETYIFQFELLSYNATYHTEAALDTFLYSTFMASTDALGTTICAPATSQTYANIFYTVGSKLGVSPFHLASRVYQEQGKGTSGLISGSYPGYEGYYNYFNIDVTSGSASEKIVKGLTYAKANNWNSAYASILGGAKVISQNYILKGQDTIYLQKYNVTSTNTYNHQYMQNISAPSSEGKTTYNLYNSTNNLNSPFVFKIPVYNNMPDTACTKPTSTTHVVLKIPSGYDSTVYVDGVAKTAITRNGNYIINMGNTSARNAVVYKYNSSGVPVGMYVWTISYKNNNYYETAETELTDLLAYHGFSIRITGNTGIRFKSSIPVSTRNTLTNSGVDGYKLVEYGTLIMNNKYTDSNPFVYGGSKITKAVAYSSSVDNIYATVNSRYQYTAVLTNIPADQYKTSLAFRSYAILEKNGDRSIVYGPVQARSMYYLASQYISNGAYKAGSSEYNYLQNIISSAK